jgi:hypothetical protein
MSLTWGAYQDQIRRSILNDTELANWTAEQVYDYIGWALDRFAEHTALLTEITYTDDDYDMATVTRFDMPSDIIDDIETAGQLTVTTESDQVYHLDPIDKTPGLTPHIKDQPSYWEMPSGKVNINMPIGAGGSLAINYFSYYPKPTYEDEESLILMPRWAWKPVASLIGAFALEGNAVQSATIDRWKDESDSGNPEHNALRAQQDFLIRQYELEIARRPRQERTNFFRRFEQWQT